MNNRNCYRCDATIRECMGSVHAGSFLEASKRGTVYELCPRCATLYANDNFIEEYPQPGNYLLQEKSS